MSSSPTTPGEGISREIDSEKKSQLITLESQNSKVSTQESSVEITETETLTVIKEITGGQGGPGGDGVQGSQADGPQLYLDELCNISKVSGGTGGQGGVGVRGGTGGTGKGPVIVLRRTKH
ncbi:hypothetical protein C8R45DRAFT_1111398 [Mycena sanguinolenta]|nr:hypothetical protein C8R45DRAFT_1111398 [Mycena sanguinolenta]